MKKLVGLCVLVTVCLFSGALFAGKVGGPGVKRSRVDAHDTEWYEMWYTSGHAELFVRGDRSTDLDCWAYDDDDNLLDSDVDSTDQCVLVWHQWGRDRVKLRVRNYGSVYNAIVISTN